MAPYFSPPMWEQRRMCIAKALYTHKVQSVLEIGCGEGNVLAFLTGPTTDDEHPITELAGVDISADALGNAKAALEPTPHDHRYPRVDELRIRLYHGDGTGPPIEGVGGDAIVCSEVIEHVQPAQVAALTNAILGGYRPRVAVFTTPNTEFNVNFPGLAYGTPQAKFRDDDHKFEWTRAEFEQWAHKSAQEHGYTVEMRAIGLTMRNAGTSFVACGGCTQMTLFVRSADDSHCDSPASALEPALLFASIDYPVYSLPRLADEQLCAFVLEQALQAADNDDDDDDDDDHKDGRTVSEDALWEMLEVKYQFRRRRALTAWLATQPELLAVVDDTQPSRRYRLLQ